MIIHKEFQIKPGIPGIQSGHNGFNTNETKFFLLDIIIELVILNIHLYEIKSNYLVV